MQGKRNEELFAMKGLWKANLFALRSHDGGNWVMEWRWPATQFMTIISTLGLASGRKDAHPKIWLQTENVRK